jgi:AsmA family
VPSTTVNRAPPGAGFGRERRWLIPIGALVLVVAIGVGSILAFDFNIALEGQRGRIERAMSDALGIPVALSGSIRFHTGPRAGLEVGPVRIGHAPGSGVWTVDAARLIVRVQTLALLRRDIRIVEAAAEGTVVCVHGGSGTLPAPSLESARQGRPAPSWALSEVARLQARQVTVVVDPDCDPARAVVELPTVELSAPSGAPVRISARALLFGEAARIEAQAPSLAAFAARRPDQPFELSADFAASTARASGRIDLEQPAFEAQVDFRTPRFQALIRPLGAPFREFGPVSARAHVAASLAGVRVTFDELSLVPVTATGTIELDWSGPRPAVHFAASTERLDVDALRDWLDRSLDTGRSGQGQGRMLDRTLAALRASDGHFAVGIGQLDAGPTRLSDLSWDGRWQRGEVVSNARGTLRRSPITASANADLRGEEAVLTATATAQQVELPPDLGVAGVIGSLRLELAARGALGGGAALHPRAILTARSAKLVAAAGKSGTVPLNLSRARVEWRAGESLVGEAAGTVFGKSLQARLDGRDVAALWHGRPWALRVKAAVAALRIASEGSLARRGGRIDADLRFDLHADHLGRSVSEALAELPLSAQGAFRLADGTWRVDLRRMAWGRTDASGWAGGRLPMREPWQGEVQFGTLDLTPFASGRAAAKPGGVTLPRKVALPAADLVLGAARVVLPGTVVTRARIDASVRDGGLDQAPFAFELDGAAVKGALSADFSGTSARLALRADASGISEAHFGHILTDRGLGLRVGELKLVASSSGNQVDELTANARADVTVRRATLTSPERGKVPAIAAAVSAATISAAPGRPTRVALDGGVDGLPAHLEASLPGLGELGRAAETTFELSGRLDRIEFGAAGPWPRSGPQDRSLHLSIAVPTLAALDRMLGQALPGTGPLRVEADLLGLAGDRPSASARIGLGESRIDARLARRMNGERPQWDLHLTSPRLRLEDLGSAGWIARAAPTGEPVPAAGAPPGPSKDVAPERRRRIGEGARVALQSVDARARIAVDRVTSGSDDFGTLSAEATLDAGRLRIAPLTVIGPRGELSVAFDADVAAKTAPFVLDAELTRFEYGRLVQSIDPGHSGDGELSLRAKLEGAGGDDDLARSLDGAVGLLILPTVTRDLSLLERWGGGLLRNIGSTLDSAQSRLNCGVATFDVTGGVARSRALMFDTTRTRVAGELELDLESRRLKGLFAPKSKQPALFAAQVPITVAGTLEAPTITPLTGSMLLATMRYVYFAYAFAFDTIGSAGYVPDGTPDCVAAYRKLLP